jgi:hypothetical protein
MRRLLLAVTTLWTVGCAPHMQAASANLEGQVPFGVVKIDFRFSYLIDPRTESCFLWASGADFNFALEPVSCAKLKKNVPEAAQHITWQPE